MQSEYNKKSKILINIRESFRKKYLKIRENISWGISSHIYIGEKKIKLASRQDIIFQNII